MGSNYTDQNRVRNPIGAHVCEACCYVHSRTSPVLGRPPKEGKAFGGNFRNYSHFWEDGIGYVNASKGEKPAILAFISRAHRGAWFAAIADSGQKHVLPFAPMNGPGPGGLLIFEEAIVAVPAVVSLPGEMSALLTAGATKEEIERGDYRPATWQRCGDAARTFEARNGFQRGSSWFALSVWLAQRDEEAVATRQAAEKEEKSDRRKGTRKASDANRGGAACNSRRVSADRAGERAEALGDPTVAVPSCGSNDSEPRRVVYQAPKGPPDPSTGQRSLFDLG
jgi:hypothetical protein